jgi:hypothetical protein
MELREFAARASETDCTTDPDRGLQIVLHRIAGEAGSAASVSVHGSVRPPNVWFARLWILDSRRASGGQ